MWFRYLDNFSCFCCRLIIFFKINLFKKFFQEHYQRVRRFGSRSEVTFFWPWSGSKLFAISVITATSKEKVDMDLLCGWRKCRSWPDGFFCSQLIWIHTVFQRGLYNFEIKVNVHNVLIRLIRLNMTILIYV